MSETHFIGNVLDDMEEDKRMMSSNSNESARKLPLRKPETRLLYLDTRAELAKFRSSSAPPEQMTEQMEPTTPLTNERDQFRSDPAYYQFYYSQRLLNPRLPPPINRDWTNDSSSIDHQPSFNQSTSFASNGLQQPQQQQQQQQAYESSYLSAGNAGWSSPDAKNKRASVVDRIQEDFPRTPSPVYHDSKRINMVPGNQLSFDDEDALQYNPYQQLQQQQQQQQQLQHHQNVSPMFFPSNRSSDDVLTQQMNNLSLDKRKPQTSNTNYYSGQLQFNNTNNNRQYSPQQQTGGYSPQQIAPQNGNASYGFYPPQNMSYAQQQGGAYPPQFSNNSNAMADQFGARGMTPQTNTQYAGNQYYGGQQQQQQQSQSQPISSQPSGTWNQQIQSPQVENQLRNQFKNNQAPANQGSNAAQGRSNGNRPGTHKSLKQEMPEPITDSQVPRSKLMEEFKSGKGRKFELRDIVGYVVEFSKDQHGSRFIQQKLETATPEEKEMVFKEVSPHALKLITDVFGNYVIQKLFEYGLPSQKKALVKSLKGHVLSLTLQTYGCRVIQKALEVIENVDKRELSQELDGHVMKCIQDQNGNHVIQKCIEKMPASLCQFIVDAFQGNIVSQAVHAYGCRVIQRILEHCNEQQTQQILDEILVNVHKLVKNQYGNYVVQHVLEHGIDKHKADIIKSLKGYILPLSHDKYASNVIEKCFQYGQRKERNEMIDEIIGKGSGKDVTQSPLFEMMKDKFANYVIQKVIEMAEDSQRKTLFDVMKPQANAIRKLTFGKHIIAVIEKDCGPLGA